MSNVNCKVKAIKPNKNVLKGTASCKLSEIQRKCGELDKMEKPIQGILKGDMDNRTLVGQLLEDSVRGILGKQIRKEKRRKPMRMHPRMGGTARRRAGGGRETGSWRGFHSSPDRKTAFEINHARVGPLAGDRYRCCPLSSAPVSKGFSHTNRVLLALVTSGI